LDRDSRQPADAVRLRKFTPVSKDALDHAAVTLALPADLRALYEVANGLSYEWFKILPLYDDKHVKRTWDSLQKANSLDASKFDVDEELLRTFVIFSEIGGGEFAAIDRRDGAIWYVEGDELHQTDLDLARYIEACFNDVDA
jgi:hypothetical protein